jgi:hypothetical protein
VQAFSSVCQSNDTRWYSESRLSTIRTRCSSFQNIQSLDFADMISQVNDFT